MAGLWQKEREKLLRPFATCIACSQLWFIGFSFRRRESRSRERHERVSFQVVV